MTARLFADDTLSVDDNNVTITTRDGAVTLRGCLDGTTNVCSSSSLGMGNAKANDMYIGGGAILLIIILVIVFL